jgi:transmembrane sensor
MRVMSAEPDWNLIDRYFKGECTPEEMKTVDEWLLADSSHAQLLASMRRVWEEAALSLPQVDEKAAWLSFQARRDAAEPVPRAGRTAAPRFRVPAARRSSWHSPALAAGLLVTVAVGGFGWWKHNEELRLATTAPPREYLATRGQRAEMTLIDGTRVWLSADSRLLVPQSYGATDRTVTLDGEGYFVVQHDARRPFRVIAGGSIAEDLGTEFDVRAYPGDSAAVVIVESGQVALRIADSSAARVVSTQLNRGQMGRMDSRGDVQVTDNVDVASALAWRNGRLSFNERPLSEVARDLERWYDIDIAFDDSTLAGAPLTASFTSQSADQALAIVAGALGARFTRDGRAVRFMTTSP